MSDSSLLFLIFGTATGVAITWFIVQTIYIKKLKSLLTSEGWTIVQLSLFRYPKLRLARIADSYVLRRSGRYPLLVAQKITQDQLQLFEVNAMSSPAPITFLPLYSVVSAATTGTYSMTLLAMPITDKLSDMDYKSIKNYINENAQQIKILSFGSNLPNRWARTYTASKDVWNKN